MRPPQRGERLGGDATAAMPGNTSQSADLCKPSSSAPVLSELAEQSRQLSGRAGGVMHPRPDAPSESRQSSSRDRDQPGGRTRRGSPVGFVGFVAAEKIEMAAPL